MMILMMVYLGLFKSAFGFVDVEAELEVFAKAVAKVEVNRVELRCGVVGKGNLVGNIVGEVSVLLPIPFSSLCQLCVGDGATGVGVMKFSSGRLINRDVLNSEPY